jgi:hypothetical protein
MILVMGVDFAPHVAVVLQYKPMPVPFTTSVSNYASCSAKGALAAAYKNTVTIIYL